MKLVLGTRGSPLALWQAETTRELLLLAHPQAEIPLVEIRSSGDADQTSDLARFGATGIFSVQVDETDDVEARVNAVRPLILRAVIFSQTQTDGIIAVKPEPFPLSIPGGV